MNQDNRPFMKDLLPLILYGVFLFAVFNFPRKIQDEKINRFHLDKIAHALLFIPLPALLIQFIRRRKPATSRLLCAFIALLFATGCAFTTEFQQKINPYRTFDEYDIVADVVGAVIGLVLYFSFFYPKPKK
jgi:VanZ family protein